MSPTSRYRSATHKGTSFSLCHLNQRQQTTKANAPATRMNHTHIQNVTIPSDLKDTSYIPGNCTYPALFLKHHEFTNHIYPWFPFQKLDAEQKTQVVQRFCTTLTVITLFSEKQGIVASHSHSHSPKLYPSKTHAGFTLDFCFKIYKL